MDLHRDGFGYIIFTAKRNELDHLGYTILRDFSDYNNGHGFTTTIQDNKNKFPKDSFQDINKFLLETFPSEEALPDDSS